MLSILSTGNKGRPLRAILTAVGGAVLLAGAAAAWTYVNAFGANAPAKGGDMSLKITSTAFGEGEMIPRKHTCDGRDVSPPLAWTGVPAGAKTLALISDDPDAPAGTWVHWVVYNLPAGIGGLAEATPPDAELKGGGRQGKNDFRRIGYGGPCPPSGTHRYFFKLYALDVELNQPPGATKADVVKAMAGHILAEAQLMGKYKRS